MLSIALILFSSGSAFQPSTVENDTLSIAAQDHKVVATNRGRLLATPLRPSSWEPGTRISLDLDGTPVNLNVLDAIEQGAGGFSAWGISDDDQATFYTGSSHNYSLTIIDYVASDDYYVFHDYTSNSFNVLTAINHDDTILDCDVTGTTHHNLHKQNHTDEPKFSNASRSTTTIDIMFVWTTDAVAEIAAGLPSLPANHDPNCVSDSLTIANCLVASANAVYSNSNIALQLNLVHNYESPVSDSQTSIGSSLSEMNSISSVFGMVPILREAYQADLIACMQLDDPSTGAAAIANLGIGINQNCSAYKLYSTLLTTRYVFAHEIGHNLGIGHNNSKPGAASYAAGYRIDATNRSVVSGGGGNIRLPYHSDPDILVDINGTPTPLGVPIGIAGEADATTFIRDNMDLVAAFRSGTQDLTDCDANGELDALEIYFDSSLDCNENGQLDSCDIANQTSTDCDTNGVPDSCQLTELNPTVRRSIQPGAATSFSYDLTGTLTVKSDVTMTVTSRVKCTNTSDWDVYINGVFLGTLFENTILNNNCNSINTDSIVLSSVPENMSDLEIQITQGTINVGGPSPCSEGVEIELVYHAAAPNDINRNGLFDPCEPGCTPYDIVEPFGQFTYFDLQQFLTWYNNGDLRADFAPPFGELNFFDVSAYNMGYQAGCP